MMGYIYIDTGAMYRAIALKAQRCGISFDALDALTALASETRIDLRASERHPAGVPRRRGCNRRYPDAGSRRRQRRR